MTANDPFVIGITIHRSTWTNLYLYPLTRLISEYHTRPVPAQSTVPALSHLAIPVQMLLP